MGVRLAAVIPARNPLRNRAFLHLGLSLALLVLGILRMLYGQTSQPALWLTEAAVLYGLGFFCMSRGMKILGDLMKTLELYEDAIVYQNLEIPVANVFLLSWEIRPRFTLDKLYRREPVLCVTYSKDAVPENTGVSPQPKGRSIRFWERDFVDLHRSFDEAYVHSLPERVYTK